MIGKTKQLRELDAQQLDIAGNATIGRAVTRTIRVSPDGDNTDGSSWAKAINSLSDALDLCSTDVTQATLILVGPQTGNVHYDINRAGDPSWSCNVIIQGTHRTWAKIMNDHPGATSIMNFTGYTSLNNLNFNLGTGNNGVSIAKGAFRLGHVQFIGEDLASAKTALTLGNGTVTCKHGKAHDVEWLGDGGTHMKGLLLNKVEKSRFEVLRFHECQTAIQIIHADSDSNIWEDIDIGHNTLGLDIDAGNTQHFLGIDLHDNTTNVDDEVGDHIWEDIRGEFPIAIEPADLTGTAVNTHVNANTWGADTQLRAAAASTVPFRIVGVSVEPSAAGWFSVRFSADSGATFYDEVLFDATKREGQAAPPGTEFIFNAGTRISASAQSDTGNDTVQVWLEIQEI